MFPCSFGGMVACYLTRWTAEVFRPVVFHPILSWGLAKTWQILMPVTLLLMCLLPCADSLCLVCQLPHIRGSSILRNSSSFNIVTLPPSCPCKSQFSGGEHSVLPFFLLPFEGVLYECLGEYYSTLGSGKEEWIKSNSVLLTLNFEENIGYHLFLKSINFLRLVWRTSLTFYFECIFCQYSFNSLIVCWSCGLPALTCWEKIY